MTKKRRKWWQRLLDHQVEDLSCTPLWILKKAKEKDKK